MNFLYITLTLLNLILNTKKMFKANLYLVRHAETEANKANILVFFLFLPHHLKYHKI